MLTWSYGVTTCPQRLDNLLPRTLDSLDKAGFPSPWLFVDGETDREFCLPTVKRSTVLGAFGSWVQAAWGIYLADSKADRYAIFQDDIVLCRNVRTYLEAVEYPKQGYLNLYTFATNENKVFGKPKGFLPSDQLGKGAVALVFDHMAIHTLLQQSHLVNKPQLPNGKKNVDGAIQHAMVIQAHFKEYIHNPSLVQHTGKIGTLHNPIHPLAKTFPGENFDAMELISHG